jgi:hypothetical protein
VSGGTSRGNVRGVTPLPRALAWQRIDLAGSEFCVFDDSSGLRASGTAVAGDAYACRYDLTTDASWATTRFEVSAQGAGWTRSVRLVRADRGWRVTAREEGTLRGAGLPGIEDPSRLDAALDIDLYASPLTNTLPIRRLRLAEGRPVTILAAWVLLPSLAVIPSEQTYTRLSRDRVRYSSDDFTADIDIDADGYVTHYPGLASR